LGEQLARCGLPITRSVVVRDNAAEIAREIGQGWGAYDLIVTTGGIGPTSDDHTRAAVASARLRGRGDEKAADQAAVDAMRRELNRLPIDGTVVIGEGERDEAPMLFIGERLGTRTGPRVDIAVDPLEGTTLCAKDMPGSIAVMAMAQGGTLLNAPDVYMDKIAIGGGYPEGIVDLDADPRDNIMALAKAKGVRPQEIKACILDRPRHSDLINKVRQAGAAVSLISDGDIAGVIHTSDPETGIDIYIGQGGAPEGVLAAAALRCVGGQIQGRLVFRNDDGKTLFAVKLSCEFKDLLFANRIKV
jgi:fructose-1,6-bisphosphatase II / sedoheptulose-1,7-bisphosphatase